MIRFTDARIPMGRDRRLKVSDWTIRSGECWVILGSGGSGKSSLARAIAGVKDSSGRLPEIRGLVRGEGQVDPGAWISFDRENEIRRELRRNDDSEWSGRPDDGTPLGAFLGAPGSLGMLDQDMASKLRGRGIRNLSTGEFRQVLIAREAGRNRRLVVLDEPWEGLDSVARPRLTSLLESLREKGALVVVTVNRAEDIPSFATGIAILSDDRVTVSPPDSLPRSGTDTAGIAGPVANDPGSPATPPTDRAPAVIPPPAEDPPEVGDILLQMSGVSLSYRGNPVLEDLDWTIRKGESWLLTGPNGSGKTSLLNLISGDEPRAYGQDITIFGQRKGSGESTSWLRRRMGRVSSALQEQVSLSTGAAEAVGSGLRDAFVLAEELDGYEKNLVDRWLEVLGLAGRGNVPFRRLSYGERRLAMIARSVIKHPPLLLLDEPMHGLDDEARGSVSALVETLIRDTGTTVLFVSHRPEDAPRSITRHLRLVPGAPGEASRAVIGKRVEKT